MTTTENDDFARLLRSIGRIFDESDAVRHLERIANSLEVLEGGLGSPRKSSSEPSTILENKALAVLSTDPERKITQRQYAAALELPRQTLFRSKSDQMVRLRRYFEFHKSVTHEPRRGFNNGNGDVDGEAW